MTAGLALAVLLSVAALVLAIIGLAWKPGPSPSAAPPATTVAPASTAETDRLLCQAIAPLIKESTDKKNAFVALGHTGTPERDAGIPTFVSATQDWIKRVQPLLDQHADPLRYLIRTLQRYIDDMHLYVSSLRPGPGTQYDEAAWTDSIVALGGPFDACSSAGVQLW